MFYATFSYCMVDGVYKSSTLQWTNIAMKNHNFEGQQSS